MSLQIREKIFFFLFFFFVFGFSSPVWSQLSYGSFQLSDSWKNRLKNVASFFYYQYLFSQNQDVSGIAIPLKVRWGYYYDSVLFFIKQNPDKYQVQYGYYDGCDNFNGSTCCGRGTGWYLKAMWDVSPTYADAHHFLSTSTVLAQPQTDYKVMFQWIDRYIYPSVCSITPGCSTYKSPVIYGRGVLSWVCYNGGAPASAFPYVQLGIGADRVASDAVSYIIINPTEPVGRIIPFDFNFQKRFYNSLVSSDSVSVSGDYFSNLLDVWPDNQLIKEFRDVGYISLPSEAVVSTGPALISSAPVVSGGGGSNNINISVNLSTINVSVDLSTTNKKLSDIYSFLSSTADIDFSVVGSSLAVATTSVSGIFSHFQNFFSPSTSDSWDCSVSFGTITFLNQHFNLGSYNLCEKWGWVFDLLRSMLRLGAYVMAFWIIADGLKEV